MRSRVDTQRRLQDLKIYTLPGFIAKGELTNMVEMRRDITKRAPMANEFNSVWLTQGRAGDMTVHSVKQESRVGQSAKAALAQGTFPSMATVSDADPGA